MAAGIGLLVVDDNRIMREALRTVFVDAGIGRLGEAATCAEALDLLRRDRFDVVLLDVVLTDGSGLELLPQIKAINESLSVVLHSYHDEPRLVSLALERGACGYLVKGVDKNQLVEAVRLAARGERLWMDQQPDHSDVMGAFSSGAGRSERPP